MAPTSQSQAPAAPKRAELSRCSRPPKGGSSPGARGPSATCRIRKRERFFTSVSLSKEGQRNTDQLCVYRNTALCLAGFTQSPASARCAFGPTARHLIPAFLNHSYRGLIKSHPVSYWQSWDSNPPASVSVPRALGIALPALLSIAWDPWSSTTSVAGDSRVQQPTPLPPALRSMPGPSTRCPGWHGARWGDLSPGGLGRPRRNREGPWGPAPSAQGRIEDWHRRAFPKRCQDVISQGAPRSCEFC